MAEQTSFKDGRRDIALSDDTSYINRVWSMSGKTQLTNSQRLAWTSKYCWSMPKLDFNWARIKSNLPASLSAKHSMSMAHRNVIYCKAICLNDRLNNIEGQKIWVYVDNYSYSSSLSERDIVYVCFSLYDVPVPVSDVLVAPYAGIFCLQLGWLTGYKGNGSDC